MVSWKASDSLPSRVAKQVASADTTTVDLSLS
jgi:hypothetical protein